MSKAFSLRRRLRSVGYAISGIRHLLIEQHNARIHLAATIIVVGAAAVLGFSRLEWGVLLLVVGLVWVAEAVNTALEYLADAAVPEQHPLVGRAKDVAAGGVLVAAAVAVAVGALLFVPHLFGAG